MRKLLSNLFDLQLDATCRHCNNQSCVKLSENPVFHDKLKHIKIKYHYISYMLIHRNIPELHCSSLHHIPDIVIFDLDMLRLVMETGFSDNFTQLWLSQYIQVASKWRSNKSDSSFLGHTASQLDEQVATYSASVVLSATQDCFLLNQEITPDPILKQHPNYSSCRWHCLPNLNQHNPLG